MTAEGGGGVSELLQNLSYVVILRVLEITSCLNILKT